MVFVKGQSGNPLGRPRGSKNKLSEQTYDVLANDFEEHGADAIQRVREADPASYLRFVASVLPKELELAVRASNGLSDDNAEILTAVLAAVQRVRPGADKTEVLQFVTDAIKLHSAKVIENAPLQHGRDNTRNS